MFGRPAAAAAVSPLVMVAKGHAAEPSPPVSLPVITLTKTPRAASGAYDGLQAQLPPPQSWSAPHTLPHAPQFLTSVLWSTQAPPHVCLRHAQAPWLQSGVGCAQPGPWFRQAPAASHICGCAP